MILRNGKHKIQITAVFNVIALNNHLISSDYLDINRSSGPTDSFCKCVSKMQLYIFSFALVLKG